MGRGSQQSGFFYGKANVTMIKLQVGIENRMGSGKKGFCIKKGGKGVPQSSI